MRLSKGKKLLVLGIVLVVIDQIIKFLVKTNMCLGENINVFGNWFQILFIENEGMAFGMKFGGMAGKLFLTLFRVGLFTFLCWWITSLVRRDPGRGKVPAGVLVGLTLITAGAMGNIIDCLFYGRIFSASTPETVAVLGGSYAPIMFGKVVDMFYFPIIDTFWPSWVPIVGGDRLLFFAPVFNFADSCVTVGALYLIIFQAKFFVAEEKRSEEKKDGEKKGGEKKKK